ncbi:hypothetical protein HK102_009311 [Quaeritorhiza haematococci]|nr:hypothetical protein HK102_009311 [Quaeritorhiza haematococci]
MAASVVALNLACTKNQFDVARFLVENIAVDYANAPAQLISAAAGRGVKRLVSFLLDNGVNVDSHDGKPLLQAAQGGHLNIIDLLLERGANVNVDGRGARALLAAVSGDHSSVVKRLLDLNIASDPPLLNEALRLAAKSESPELCTILMDRGANPNSLGYLALFNALEGRNASVVELLLAVVAAQFFTSRCFSMALSEVEGFPGLVQRLENSRQNAQSRTDTDESS